jgi:hypothetical protein
VIFVAIKGRIEELGLTPYRRRAKRLIYQERVDAVYLMARDDNIPPVKDLRDILAMDALIEDVATYEYRLRADFTARILNRERAICVVLRRRRADDLPAQPPDDIEEAAPDDDVELYDFELGVLKPEREGEEAVPA